MQSKALVDSLMKSIESLRVGSVVDAQLLSELNALKASIQSPVGVVSIGKSGVMTLHQGVHDHDYLTKLLNDSVTGGPYTTADVLLIST